MDKRCKKCGAVKPLDAFYAEKGGRDGRRPECKACTNAARKRWYRANRDREIARVKQWQQANPERVRAWRQENRAQLLHRAREIHLRRTFGLTVGEYNALLDRQGGGCAVCGAAPPANGSLHVDHDHETGVIRGLLCFRCNGGMGQFKENVERLHRAADYLDSGGFVPSGTRELTELARQRARSLVS